MRSLDRPTRSDDEVVFVDAATLFEEHLPPLIDRHGVLTAIAWAHGRPAS